MVLEALLILGRLTVFSFIHWPQTSGNSISRHKKNNFFFWFFPVAIIQDWVQEKMIGIVQVWAKSLGHRCEEQGISINGMMAGFWLRGIRYRVYIFSLLSPGKECWIGWMGRHYKILMIRTHRCWEFVQNSSSLEKKTALTHGTWHQWVPGRKSDKNPKGRSWLRLQIAWKALTYH